MQNEELLSKKDLLRLTGISYGQLYRWKRQNLIPESWFIKQSSFTGQETFFPRQKILKRVQTIMELKDQYSLEELADLLAPEASGKNFAAGDLGSLPGLDPHVLNRFREKMQKNSFTFKEVLVMYLLSQAGSRQETSGLELDEMIESFQNWLPGLKNTTYKFVICRREGKTFWLLAGQGTTLLLDHLTTQQGSFDLDELAKDLKFKLARVIEAEG